MLTAKSLFHLKKVSHLANSVWYNRVLTLCHGVYLRDSNNAMIIALAEGLLVDAVEILQWQCGSGYWFLYTKLRNWASTFKCFPWVLVLQQYSEKPLLFLLYVCPKNWCWRFVGLMFLPQILKSMSFPSFHNILGETERVENFHFLITGMKAL